jgi:hypothetical protein
VAIPHRKRGVDAQIGQLRVEFEKTENGKLKIVFHQYLLNYEADI